MIVSRLYGGLGNQMFQYALAKHLAIKNDTNVFFDVELLNNHSSENKYAVFRNFDLDIFNFKQQFVSKEVSEKFNGKRNLNLLGKIIQKVKFTMNPPKLIIESGRQFNKEILNTQNNYALVGAFQSPLYFDDVKDEILKDFSIKLDFIENNFYESIIYGAEVSVSLHVRRGDYVTNKIYNNLLGVQPVDYYVSSIEVLKNQINRELSLFIFSDDINWCKQNLGFLNNVTFVENTNSKKGFATDLFLMLKCDHHIISHSTYSWWGAYLGENKNGITIAPKLWVSEKYINNPKYHPVDIIPKNWITI